MNNDKILTPKPHTALLFAAFIIIIAGMMYAQSIINPLLMALFLGIICIGPLNWLKKRNVPAGLALTIIIIGILAIYLSFGELIWTSVSYFMEDAPKYEESLREIINSTLQFLKDRGIEISSISGAETRDPSNIMELTAIVLQKLGDVMSDEFTIIFLFIFLIAEAEDIYKKIDFMSNSKQIPLSYLKTIGDGIRHYLSIKTITSLMTGLIIWIILSIVGIDYAILWGMIAFLLNYIPNIGSIMAAIPAILFALLQLGIGGMIWTGLTFIVVNMVIGNVIEPKIMGKGLGLSTFVVFFALIFWGFVLGIIGMFLSVPITMAIKIILENNPKTKWIAVLLGTSPEVQKIPDVEKK
jgi:predicted PurR-regulated permease PerM